MGVANNVVLVAIGGSLGAVSRHGFNVLFVRFGTPAVATLSVNVIGCVLLGALVQWFAVHHAGWWQSGGRLLLATGFCGAFTTMSALALDTQQISAGGSQAGAIGFALLTLVLSIAGLFAGMAASRVLL